MTEIKTPEDKLDAINHVDHITDTMISVIDDRHKQHKSDFTEKEYHQIFIAILILYKNITYNIAQNKYNNFDALLLDLESMTINAGIPFKMHIAKINDEDIAKL